MSGQSSAVVVAAAFLSALAGGYVGSQHHQPAAYAIASSNGLVWKLNTVSGELRVCRAQSLNEAPACSDHFAKTVSQIRAELTAAQDLRQFEKELASLDEQLGLRAKP